MIYIPLFLSSLHICDSMSDGILYIIMFLIIFPHQVC